MSVVKTGDTSVENPARINCPMTKYEPITRKRIGAFFFWTLLLYPVILFVLAFTISLLFKGYAATLNQVEEFAHDLEIVLALGYFVALAIIFTLILVLANAINNYHWKKFFTSDAVETMLKKSKLTLNQEGIHGEYRGVQLGILYDRWRDFELVFILLAKSPSASRDYEEIKNHDFGKDCTLTNSHQVFQIRVNVKGKKRKKELDFEKLIDKAITFTENRKIDLFKGNPASID